MARPQNSETVGMFTLLNCLKAKTNIFKPVKEQCLQYFLDLITYYKEQVEQNYCLRLEDAVTLDHLMTLGGVGDMINELELFNENGTMTAVLTMLENNCMLYRINKVVEILLRP
ncbi:hypothetical protein PUN28_002196 [Cardiocondyla obscurior]|uniref:Uncharacterized protein n=1 Tax=Cardiocondyla obscurior TaxID=286306 RepID=A0AAW2GT19_9HYME